MTRDSRLAGAADRQVRRFTTVWLAHVVSVIGSGLTSFTLGVWILEKTDSVTFYAWNAVAASLPGILLAPLGGALIDRWDRRWVMIVSALGSAGATLGLIVLVSSPRLELWQVYSLISVNAMFGFFQIPAFTAVTTLLLPARQYARASGLVNFGHSTAYILAPVLAGWLLVRIQAQGVLWLDVGTFGFAILLLVFVRLPEPDRSDPRSPGDLRRDLSLGVIYIFRRPGLRALTLYFFLLNLFIPACILLATPLVLSFTSVDDLGIVLGLAATGSLVGAVAIIVWGGASRQMSGILKLTPWMGVGLIIAGSRPAVPWIATGLFLTFLVPPLIGAMSQAIWQVKVPPDLQGRVFAARQMIAYSSIPIGALLAGPLTEEVLQPLMGPGGCLAQSLGRMIGVGEGRGVAFAYWIMGALVLLTAAGGAWYRPLRHLEDELPDAFRQESLEGMTA